MIIPHWAGNKSPELNAALAAWCADRIGISRGLQEPFVSLAIMDGDRLIAVVVYNNWNPDAGVIELHAASIDKRWLTRPVLKEMFSYPFDRAGAQMVVLRVAPSNKSFRRIVKSYGFQQYVIPRLRGRDEDEVICTLTEEDWRANGFHSGIRPDLSLADI